MQTLRRYFTFITDEEIRELHKWQYQGGPPTLVDRIMDPFWVFCERKTPRWMSPNAVTFLGTTLMFLITFFIAIFGARFEERTIPALLTLFAMFAYQTLDAVDGKHARALGMTSPFGSMLDHGCDTFAMFLQSMLILHTLNPELQLPIFFFVPFLSALTTFYLIQWAHRFEGRLKVEGVTENQFVAMSIVLPNLIYGKEFWDLPIVKYGVGTLIMICSIVMGFTAIIRVFRQFGMRVLPLLLPMVSTNSLALIMYYSGSFHANPLIACCCVGMTFTLSSLRFVIGNMAKDSADPLAHMMIPVTMLAVATACPCLLLPLLVVDAVLFVFVASDTTVRVCGSLNIPIISVQMKQN